VFHHELLGGSIYTTVQERKQINNRTTNSRAKSIIQISADNHAKHGLIDKQTRRQGSRKTQDNNYRRKTDPT
jgi:hypothetical protein